MDEDIENMDSDEILVLLNTLEKKSSHKIEDLMDKLEASGEDHDQLVLKLKRLRVFLDDPPARVSRVFLNLRPKAYEVVNAISSFVEFNKEDELNPPVLKDLSSKFHQYYVPLLDTGADMVMREIKSSKPPSLNDRFFPRTDQMGFIKHLVGHLEDVLQRKADSIRPLKLDVRQLQEKFKYVLYCLMEIPKFIWEEFDIHDLLTNITNLAYEAEYLIDGIVVRNKPLWYSMYSLIDIDAQLKDHLNLIKSKNWLQHLVNSHGGSSHVQVVSYLFSDPTFWVFFYNFPLSLGFGCSKSTSGKEFDAFLFCCIGEIYEKNVEILYEIVDGMVRKASGSHTSVDRYRSLVAEILPGRRYLVVVWVVNENQALVDMLSCLPENNDGSRVIVVTSSQEMRSQIQRCPCMRSLLEGQCSSATSMMQSTASESSRIHMEAEGDGVVGFKDESERMMNWLLRGRRRPLEIASIFGMAGQGKTTLANKLFKMASTANYFHVCAWCCVSQVYKLRQLLLELVSQVVDHPRNSSSFEKESDYDLMETLHKNLLGRTFFIVMDDIWDLRAWDELRRCFPNQNNGSCILFTTRIQNLVSGCITQQPLNPLSDEESWELFKMQLYMKKQHSCLTDELQPIAREIAKNCNGLPLAIVLSAGLISKMDDLDNVIAWEKLAETLSREILGDSEAHCQGILELSYKHLPENLKACFLYLGSLPKNEVVSVTKITKLWIAEGFIHSSQLDRLVKSFDHQKFSYLESQSEISNELETACKDISADLQQTSSFEEGDSGGTQLISEEIIDRIEDSEEDIAEAYLMELVQRSFVQVSSQKSIGGVKACQVHDLLRSFCLIKASEDNFLLHQVIDNAYNEPQFPSNICHFRRLSIIVEGNEDFVMSQPSEPNVRTFLFSAVGDQMHYNCKDVVHFICDNFRFLTILNLEGIDILQSFREITDLVHLRYLAVQCSNEDYIPRLIANLCNLETLIVTREKYATIPLLVPDSIWDMTELRHVDIFNCQFQLNPLRIENESNLSENLLSLSNLSLPYGVDMEKFLKKLPNIRKLNCKWDDTVCCNRFLRLEFLDHLEALKVSYTGEGNYSIVNFPSNLTKLTLSNFRMPWRNISQLTKLSNLKVLKLTSEAFEGEAWEMEEDEVFQNLRFLKLDSLNLVTWIALESSFPCLEHLVLHRCNHLQEIPAGFGDIPTLQRIEVMWCNRSTAISAREIQKEQLEYGNECLKIRVHPRELDDCQ